MIAGGLLLVAAGLTAIAAPRRAPRRPALGWRLAHGAGWLAAVPVFALLAVMPFAMALLATHAPRWAIQESSLGIPHQEVAIETADGRELSGWYVPSRNRTAVLLSHGSGGSRERVAAHVRMLARHGYGVLALDNPGNGESEGHSNGLGYNAQPAVDAAIGWLARRPDVDPRRIAGFGSSLGAEVLLEAAAREPRLRAVVADGPTRPMDGRRVGDPALPERLFGAISLQAVRGDLGHARGAVADRDHAAHRAPSGAADRRRRRSAGRDPRQPRLPRRRRPHHAALGAPGRRPHRRPAHPPRRVRAADHRVPRPGPRAQGDPMTILRYALLVGAPLAFSVLLWFHPMIGDYEGLQDVTTRFQVVHIGMVLALPLLAIGIHGLLDGLRGRAAAVGRFALVPFVAFYVPYVAFEGIALGVLGEQLNGLPAAQRDAVAPGMVEDFARNPILGEPGVFWAVGSARADRRHGLDRAGLPPCRRAADAPGPARPVGADRHARPAARPDRMGLLRRGRLDGAAGAPQPRSRSRPPWPREARSMRRSPGLFVAGVGAIALHVLDDNFVQPQPGTAAGDHLVSGLVPLAVLAFAAWAYPRLRGGRRGALALVLGAFGIVAGIEAVHYTSQGRRVRRRLHRAALDPGRAGCCSASAPRRCGGPAAGTAAARGATCAARCSRSRAPSSACSSSLR